MFREDEMPEMGDEELLFTLGAVERTLRSLPDPGLLIHMEAQRTFDVAFALALERGLVVTAATRHNVWMLETKAGGPLFAAGMWGFKSPGDAWVCYYGMGSPDDSEIRYVVNPRMESDRVLSSMAKAMRELETPAPDGWVSAPTAAGGEPKVVRQLRLVRDDDDGSGPEVSDPSGR